MTNLLSLRVIVGLILKVFGIVWSLLNSLICKRLCRNGCYQINEGSCALILLFVGIIFIVCGYALIVVKDRRRMALQKKMLDDLLSIFR